MAEGPSKYIPGIGWRHDTEHSMHRRLLEHDYGSRCIYMLTMSVQDRRPLLGRLCVEDKAWVQPTALGLEVERCWREIPQHYPEAELLAFQLMPDHIHGLLFVTREMEVHLGQIVKGFKIGCSKAMWRLEDEKRKAKEGAPGAAAVLPSSAATALPYSAAGVLPSGAANYNSPNGTANSNRTAGSPGAAGSAGPEKPDGKRQPLFEAGYQDSVLKGKDQLEHMLRYIEDNPRRLAVKREHPDLFRVVSDLELGGQHFAAIGNQWLVERPVRLQVKCHNNSSPDNLRLIAEQKAYFLERASKGAVIVSPCISAGEKEIARAVLDAGYPLVVILESGFPPMYKPPGRYFEACSRGKLLMLAPWPYHMEKRTITRQQCLELNEMTRNLCTEPWTDEIVRPARRV